MIKKLLLTADGIINIILGTLLLGFPLGVCDFLGMPPTNNYFYTSILGGVIFGIGVALFIERFFDQSKITGLGLAGAIVINLCGGGALLIWLITSPLNLPFYSTILLWIIVFLVIGIGVIELFTMSWKL